MTSARPPLPHGRGFDEPLPDVAPPSALSANRLDDLAGIIRAYTEVTDKLQHSHEALHEEVARLQRELTGANAQLQRSKRLTALGEMAAGIAHEVRNPLGAIQLYAEMIVEDVQAVAQGRRAVDALAEPVETAGKIAAAVRGLNAIVGDVLSFAREIRPRLREVEVSLLLDRVVSLHAPAIAAAKVALVREDHRQPALVACVDPDLIVQALLNLVRNAVDAMMIAGGTVGGGADEVRQLTLDARHDESQLVLIVRDNGPGIAEQDIDRIFNPFFTTRSTGTGLGLPIVHRIVDVHGGTISVYNDSGAVFEMRLPAVPATHSVSDPIPLPLREGSGEGRAHELLASDCETDAENVARPTLPLPLHKREGSRNMSVPEILRPGAVA